MNESVPARPASTVLLVRDGASGLEVFMVVRHHQIDFASGALVFPGGSVEPEDFSIAVKDSAASAMSERERALRVGAVRETFEECGVLLARPRGGDVLIDGARCAEIGSRAAGRSFAALLADERLELALETLTPFAHWITPPIVPKRFDTHFYIVAAPPDQIALHDGSESVDSVWINPLRALSEAEAGRYTIVFPTRLNLKMLAESEDVASALAAAHARPIVTVEPKPVKTETGYLMTIPIEAGYGAETFTL